VNSWVLRYCEYPQQIEVMESGLYQSQRVSIASYAERCISYDRFCPSDRLSVTRWYHAKTTTATIMGSDAVHYKRMKQRMT